MQFYNIIIMQVSYIHILFGSTLLFVSITICLHIYLLFSTCLHKIICFITQIKFPVLKIPMNLFVKLSTVKHIRMKLLYKLRR